MGNTFIDSTQVMTDTIKDSAGTGTPSFPNGIPATAIKGNTTGTPAALGQVGEAFTVSQASLVNYTAPTNQYGNVFVINTAAIGNRTGSFLVTGECNVIANGAGGFSFDYIAISDFSNNDTTDDSFVVNRWDPANGIGRISSFVVNVTNASSKYIKVRVAYSSGTPQYRYSFRFVRIS